MLKARPHEKVVIDHETNVLLLSVLLIDFGTKLTPIFLSCPGILDEYSTAISSHDTKNKMPSILVCLAMN